jgi:hypothetical protein
LVLGGYIIGSIWRPDNIEAGTKGAGETAMTADRAGTAPVSAHDSAAAYAGGFGGFPGGDAPTITAWANRLRPALVYV